jgi:hypothetical protein
MHSKSHPKDKAMDNSLFKTIKIRELQAGDFYLGSETPTMTKNRDTTIIVFYALDPASGVSDDLSELKDMLASLAYAIAGVSFAVVNSSTQSEIMKAFFETGQDPDHPLYPFRVISFPTILVYRKGWPQAFYNGEINYDALQDYVLNTAWRPGYYEPIDKRSPTDAQEAVAYEAEVEGDQDYIEQVEEREPSVTPQVEPGALIPSEVSSANVY